tara:strand:+ start:588 stop:941 length:354 start_codon:yes stop_codon:yes gene_type:complete
MSDVNVPKNNRYMESKKNEARNSVDNAFNDFKKLLADKTHPDNQTPAYHKNVVSVLNRLLIAADELDGTNPGEGIFGLIVLSLRSTLKLKDDMLKLEVENRELKREVGRLKKNQGKR